MKKHRPTANAALALMLAIGLSLTACASSEPATGGDSMSGNASEQNDTAFTPLTIDDFAARVTAAQLKAGMAHIEQQVAAEGMTSTAVGEMTFTSDYAQTKARVTTTSPGMTTEAIIVDGKLYMNLGELTQNKFAEFGEGNGMFEPSEVIGAFTPQTQMETFASSIEELQVGETEVIDGVETTRYTLLLDSATLLSGSLTAGVDPAGVDETITYIVWVGNEDDLMRRSEMRFSDTLSSKVDFTRWGESVDIQAPSADQLTTF